MANVLNTTVPTNPFLNFGGGSSNTGGTTSLPQIGKGLVSGIASLFPLSGNQSTTPFASGGLSTPPTVGSLAQPQPPKTGLVSPPTNAPSPFQQNLSKYGLSSLPSGYAFDANGKLTNNAGQEYSPSANGSGGGGVFTSTGPGKVSIAPGTKMPDGSTFGSTGLGTGGAPAPAGFMYNGQGQIVPQDNSQTVNSSGQNAPVSTNVNTGGGTQTNFPSIVGGLASTAAASSPEYQAALDDYNQQKIALQNLQSQFGTQFGNTLNERTNQAEAQGEQGAISNAEALQSAPLTQRMQADAAILSAATAQQGTQQQGLQGAAGLVAPEPANIYGTFNPLNPSQYTGYGGGAPGGGAATAGGVGAQVQQGAAVQQMTGTQSQAQALSKNLSNLITSAGINPNNASVFSSFLNGVNLWLNTQSGDPQYQNFANLINEISSRYASILNQAGGTPTDQSTISHSIINGLASGKDIQTVLGALDKNATDSINALKGAAGINAAGGTSSTGQTMSAGGYNFKQNAQGQWVPA